MNGALAALMPLLTAATTAKKSSGSPLLLILVVVGAAFYFLIYRPQQKKAKAVREQGNAFDVGDEVLTAGGIVGYVIDIDGDRVTLETSVGASFVVLRQYVLRKIEEPVAEDDDESYDEDDEYDHDDGAPEAADEHDEVEGEGEAPSKDQPPKGGGKTGKRQSTDGDDSGGRGLDGPPIT
jgi:preprotein translocase subunit YajC